MGQRIPVAADLTHDDLTALALGKQDEVAAHLHVTRRELARLIADDKSTREMILAARKELQGFLELRVAMLAVDALDTLEMAMHEGFREPKTATAVVRAAESILDRGTLPKLMRTTPFEGTTRRDDRLPELSELVERARTDAEAHGVVDQYMDTLRRIEALKRGATQLIEGDAVEIQPES